MPEKMYGFTHLISESKLLSLIATHADEVKVDIFTPERRAKKLQNGNAVPLLIEAPHSPSRKAPPQSIAAKPRRKAQPQSPAALALAQQWGGKKWGARQVILKMAHDNAERPVSMQEFIADGKQYGVSAGAISVASSHLIKDGLIERTDIGRYKILREGIKRVDAILGGKQRLTSNSKD